MNDVSKQLPELCSITQCTAVLDFAPLSLWPSGLPAVAVNGVVFGGFQQKLIFNHPLPVVDKEENRIQIAQLFRSIYFELSFPEIARLVEKAGSVEWFPLSTVIALFGWQPTEHFFKVVDCLLRTPPEFQNWCSEKKLNPQDLSPLLSAKGLNLEWVMQDLIQYRLSKSLGVQILELTVELMLMAHPISKLRMESSTADSWLENLRLLRYPQTLNDDLLKQTKIKNLSWTGTSQIKWSRQGDKAGIELKLFISHPSEIKKYNQLLSQVQDFLTSNDDKH